MKSRGGWGVFDENTKDGFPHVAPVDRDGYLAHNHELALDCWCRPELEDGVVRHEQPGWPGPDEPEAQRLQ